MAKTQATKPTTTNPTTTTTMTTTGKAMTEEDIRRVVTQPGDYCVTLCQAGKTHSRVVTVLALWCPWQAQGLGVPDDLILATTQEWILGRDIKGIHSVRGK